MKTLSSRGRRGAATVELAVSMIALLPLLLYTMFLQDLLYYKLNMYEAVSSSPWDYTALSFDRAPTGDNRPPSTGAAPHITSVGRFNRLTYADHTSARQLYNNPNADLQDQYQNTVAAHECWLSPGAEQLLCTLDAHGPVDPALIDPVSAAPKLANGTAGGVARCDARLGVVNYFLPQRVLNWGRELTTTRMIARGSAHATGGSATPDYFTFGQEQAAVLAGTHALNHIDELESWTVPNVTHPLYLHVAAAFAAGIATAVPTINNYRTGADRFIGIQAMAELMAPGVAYKRDHRRNVGVFLVENSFATGWPDNRQSQAYNNAQEYYLRSRNW